MSLRKAGALSVLGGILHLQGPASAGHLAVVECVTILMLATYSQNAANSAGLGCHSVTGSVTEQPCVTYLLWSRNSHK